jgi:hypothetical protein
MVQQKHHMKLSFYCNTYISISYVDNKLVGEMN